MIWQGLTLIAPLRPLASRGRLIESNYMLLKCYYSNCMFTTSLTSKLCIPYVCFTFFCNHVCQGIACGVPQALVLRQRQAQSISLPISVLQPCGFQRSRGIASKRGISKPKPRADRSGRDAGSCVRRRRGWADPYLLGGLSGASSLPIASFEAVIGCGSGLPDLLLLVGFILSLTFQSRLGGCVCLQQESCLNVSYG